MGELTEIRDRLRSRDDHHQDCSKRHHMADDAVACDCYDFRTQAALDKIGAALKAGKQLADACRKCADRVGQVPAWIIELKLRAALEEWDRLAK